MFGSRILEVAIGIIFVFLLVSMICSAIREAKAGLTTRAPRSTLLTVPYVASVSFAICWGVPVQWLLQPSVSRSAADQMLKYGSQTTSGAAGGRRATDCS